MRNTVAVLLFLVAPATSAQIIDGAKTPEAIPESWIYTHRCKRKWAQVATARGKAVRQAWEREKHARWCAARLRAVWEAAK